MQQQNRIQNPTKLDFHEIDSDLKEGKLVIVQFSDKLYTDKILAELNELCAKYDENFNVRFYGHYQGSFDCYTLHKIPNVKGLYLDCLRKADNLNVLTELKNLKRLSIGVFELSELEILNSSNFYNLRELILTETKSKALNLKYLENYKGLKSLYLNGHKKNIDSVGTLENLEALSISSISKAPLNFVNRLKKLKSLHFTIGGRENLDEIEENNIESLHIRMVRGFNSFRNIGKFKNLKELLIEDEIQLTEIIIDEELPNLEDFKIFNCKTLRSLKGIDKLSKLRQLRIYKTDIDFEEFIKQSFPKSLDILAFYTTKAKIDKEIKERLLSLGYRDGLDR